MKDKSKKYLDHLFTMFDFSLQENGYRWLDSDGFILAASKNFVNSFNQLQLVFNYISNLSQEEDYRRHHGMTDYGISIPTEQFRFPFMNNQHSFRQMQECERVKIELMKATAKHRLNYVQDISLVDEMSARFEFLMLYSYFEGFCEELINEKSPLHDEKTIKANGDFIRKHNLLEIVEKVFSFYSLDLLDYIEKKYDFFQQVSRLFYELRNLYTHRNGIATKRFIDRGLQNPHFIVEWYYDREINKNLYVIDCIQGNYNIYEGKNINCQLIIAYFRVYALFIVELLNMEESEESPLSGN